MGQVNPRALYVLAIAFAMLSEVCFIPVLSVFVNKASTNTNTTFCWSWRVGTPHADNDDSCPFLVFFLAALINGCLLFFTGIYFALRLCVVAEYFQNPVCLKFIIKYSHFALALLTTLLSLTFIGLMIGYNSANVAERKEYTGGIVEDYHYYLFLVCIGAFLSLLSTVLSGVLCFRPRGSTSDFTGSGVFSAFTDYSESSLTYDQIN